MPAATRISVSEYLSTTYRPDREYVDGEVVERNLGEREHSSVQALLAAFFIARKTKWKLTALTEQRVQVKPERFRIPDVCALAADAPFESFVKHPPFLCVEILSKEDTLTSIMARLDDFLDMGVANVWLIDPRGRRGYRYTSEGMLEAKDGVLRTTVAGVEVPLTEIFEG
jgi:Uma2 family endonuclease